MKKNLILSLILILAGGFTAQAQSYTFIGNMSSKVDSLETLHAMPDVCYQVTDISSLRSMSGVDRSVVCVDGYWNGLDYGGGVFVYHTNDITGRGDDGGISFDANGVGFWVREDRQFRAIYFGAVDESDLTTISKSHSSVELQNMIDVAPSGTSLIFDGGYTFVQYASLFLTKPVTLSGYGCTLKTGDELSATLTAAPTETNTVTVTALNGLEIGMTVGIFDSANTTGGGVKITNIVGNILTLNQNITSTQTSLTTSLSNIVSSFSAGSTVEYVTVLGFTIDGNRLNSTWAWWQSHVGLYLISDNTIIENVRIYNAQSEGLLLGGENLKFSNITIDSCGGNGVHLGDTDNWQANNISIKNTQLTGTASGHTDGAFIASNLVTNGTLTNLYVENSLAVLGSFDYAGNSYNTFNNIRGVNCTYFLEAAGSIVNGLTEGLILNGFHGIDCGSIRMDYTNNSLISNGLMEYTTTPILHSNAVLFDRASSNNKYNNIKILLDTFNTIEVGFILETGDRYEISDCEIVGGNVGIQAVNSTSDIKLIDNFISEYNTIGINVSGSESLIQGNELITVNNTVSNHRAIVTSGSMIIKDNYIDIRTGIGSEFGILANTSTDGMLIVQNNIVRNYSTQKAIRLQSSVDNAELINNTVSIATVDLGVGNVEINTNIITAN